MPITTADPTATMPQLDLGADRPLRALTLWQPWATLIAVGAKRIETRGWATAYRGPLAIHAAAKKDREIAGYCRSPHLAAALEWFGLRKPDDLPFGAIVAVADLVDCRRIVEPPPVPERWYGDFTPGRYAWHLDNVRRLPKPIPARGMQGLWTPRTWLANAMMEAIA